MEWFLHIVNAWPAWPLGTETADSKLVDIKAQVTATTQVRVHLVNCACKCCKDPAGTWSKARPKPALTLARVPEDTSWGGPAPALPAEVPSAPGCMTVMGRIIKLAYLMATDPLPQPWVRIAHEGGISFFNKKTGSAMHRSRQAVARMVMVASPGSHAPANGSFPLRHVQLVEPHEPLEEALSGSELGRCEALSEELQTRQKMQECAASPWGSSQTRPRRYMEHEGRMTAWKFVERWTAVRQLGKMSSIRLFTRCLRASVGCRPRRAEPVLNGVVCFKVHMNSKGLPQASAPFWKRVGIESSESFARFGEFQGLVVRRGTVSSQFQKDVCRHRSGDGPISIDCPDVTQLRGRDAVMQEESADL
eukprot:s98_g2.t2